MNLFNYFSLEFLFWGLASFFSGSIPFGYMTVKMVKGMDIREYGSKNTGATNVGRVIGWKYGIFVLILDALKGALPVFFFRSMNHFQGAEYGLVLGLALGFLAVLGHVFSPFTGFRGGKGVATALGVCLILIPLITLCAVGIFLVIYKSSGYISLGSIVTALTTPFLYWVMCRTGIHPEYSSTVFYSLLLLGFAILIFHKDNLIRLYEGRELRGIREDTKGESP